MIITRLLWTNGAGGLMCRRIGSCSSLLRGYATTVDPNFCLKGAIAAPLTPFTPDGELMLEANPSYVQYLDEHGVDGVFATGTMGESMSMTVDERKKVAEAWMKSVETTKRLKAVVVHVGSENYKQSMELAKHAEKIGAHGVACVAPSYYKPPTEEALVEYMAKVASACPNTPFYYYDINFVTGCYLNTARFFELAEDEIPNLRGGKITSPELPNLLDCKLAARGRYQMMVGTEEQFLMSLAFGVDVPILTSHLGDLFHRLKAAYERGDHQAAMEEQVMARRLCLIQKRYGGLGPAFGKAMMRCLGVDLGSVRLPLQNLPSSKETALCKELKDIGFLK